MRIGGYAFSKDSTLPETYQKRYKELIDQEMHTKIQIEVLRNGIGSNSYEGRILQGGEELSELDIAIILDRGNLCFGGSCAKFANNFSCEIYTD